MTPAEFLTALASLGLPVAAAGPVIGVSRATAYRYAKGYTPIRESVAIILRYEVERCAVRQVQMLAGPPRWQAWRDGVAIGSPVPEKWQAWRLALDLPR
jgi:hypothetical protein